MGTSTSSNGPKSNIPLDPPWLPPFEPSNLPEENMEQGELPFPLHDNELNEDLEDGLGSPNEMPHEGYAPTRRFKPARQELSNFAGTRDNAHLGKALGHYSRTGMGGAARVAHRMGHSANVAARAIAMFSGISSQSTHSDARWLRNLVDTNASLDDIIDEIAQHLTPHIGTKDEDSCRNSLAEALLNLVDTNPNFDFSTPTPDQLKCFLESFLSHEIFNRVILDIGQGLERLNNSTSIIQIKEQIREYIQCEVIVSLERVWDSQTLLSLDATEQIIYETIKNTFIIFEGTI